MPHKPVKQSQDTTVKKKSKKKTIRPIVAKFHRYGDREKVRTKGYEKREDLKNQETFCQGTVAQRNHGQTKAAVLGL